MKNDKVMEQNEMTFRSLVAQAVDEEIRSRAIELQNKMAALYPYNLISVIEL